jgi:hypothetical protein
MLTTTDAQELDHKELIERVEELLKPYDKPEVELLHDRMERINCTLDEMPQIYRSLLQLQSWCDHWTDAFASMFGQSDRRYKAMRERRDLFENMARAAKLRYEGTSRLITLMEGFTVEGLPRTRKSGEVV